MDATLQLQLATTHEKAADLWEEAAHEAYERGDTATAALYRQRAEDNRRLAAETLPAERWEIRRGGKLLHFTSMRAEAEAHGQDLIRTETGRPDVAITWYCPACDGDYTECANCENEGPVYLSAHGILTELSYSIEFVTRAA